MTETGRRNAGRVETGWRMRMAIFPLSFSRLSAARAIRDSSAAVVGFAMWMALVTSGAAQTSPPRSLAPNVDFSKICQPGSNKPRLARDWSKWDKSQPVGDPEEMYDAAIAYAEGRADINRSPLTARKLLEDLADS